MRNVYYGIRYRDGLSVYGSLSLTKTFQKWIKLGPRKFEIYCADLVTLKIYWAV